MSWVPNKSFASSLFAAALLATANAASADILVLRADGPSARAFPPGRKLPDNARFALKASDELIVLDSRGTRTIRGPGNFIAGVAPPPRTASAEPVMQRRARVGAVRGVPNENRPPSMWHVDVAKSSTMCIADPASVNLWRADGSKPVTLTIASPSGVRRQLRWEEGSQVLAWPAGLPVTDGASYRLSWDGSTTPTEIKFKALAKLPSGLDDTATVLLANNCSAQLDLFINTLRTDIAGRG
jgi:hypothetical protein